MRLSRNAKGQFLPRRRRNPGPKGVAKLDALTKAMRTANRDSRLVQWQNAKVRRMKVLERRGQLTIAPPRRNPGRIGKHRTRPLSAAKADQLLEIISRAQAAELRASGPKRQRAAAVAKRWRAALNRRRRVGNPIPGLAGLSSINPTRSKHMARRRRRRSAAQRAATKKMLAANRAARRGGKRRRRRNPSRGATHMARRKRRRARAAVIMVNPRRRRGRPSRVRRSSKRRRFSRRRNPGFSFGSALRTVFMVGVPAVGAGGIAGFIDAKIADKPVVLRIAVKLGQALAWGLVLRRRPILAFGAMGAALGSIGGEIGTRVAGGFVVGGTPAAKAQGVAALITEDPRTMGVLVEAARSMGYAIDNNVSLGEPALPVGSYRDVNLG